MIFILKKILLGLCFCSIFIFQGILENIFIIIFTLAIYKYIEDKNTKNILVCFIIAYFILNITITGFMRDKVDLSYIERDFDEPKDTTAVVLLYDGEDDTYHLKERASEIYQTTGYSSYFDMIVRLNKYKKVYESLGSSDFKHMSYEISDGLRPKLGGDYIVINSYLYTKPYFENTLQDIISKGYKDIIICPMFISEGTDYKVFKARLDKMELAKYEVNVKTTDVFYKSNTLAKGYKDEILKNIRSDNMDVGVLLVGLNNENELEQDVLFREKIKEYIVNEKKDNIQIKLPLLENNKKDIIKSGEELLEYGIDALYIVMPTSIVETSYIRYLAEHVLQELNISSTKFYYIGPLNETNIIIEELYTKITLLK